MKKILLMICGMAPAVLWAQQEKFVLKLEMKSISPKAVAHLSYQTGDQRVSDSARVEKGAFTFRGMLPEPAVASLEIDHQGGGLMYRTGGADVFTFYLDKGENNMIANDSVKLASITGSKLNEEASLYKEQTQATQDSMGKIYTRFYSAPPEKQQDKIFNDSLTAQYEQAEEKLLALRTQFIKEHPESYVSLEILKDMADPQADLLEIEPLLKMLSSDLQHTASGVQLAEAISKARATAVGAMAPLFSQEDASGKRVSLESFRGKYVLLDFWASWCVPCRKENPNVVAAYKRFKDKNFTIVGISLDQPGKKDAWQAAIKADGLDWTQLSDLNYWDNAVVKQYGIRSIPQNYLIDPNGKIIAKNLRGEELQNKLTSILK